MTGFASFFDAATARWAIGASATARVTAANATQVTAASDAIRAVAARVTQNGKVSGKLLDREQRAAHGLSWFATYVEAIRQLASYAERMSAAGRFGATEDLLVRIGLGEYLAQMIGGIPMSQGEFVRPADLGLGMTDVAARVTPQVEALIATGNTAENRARLVSLMREHHGATVGDCGLGPAAFEEQPRPFEP